MTNNEEYEDMDIESKVSKEKLLKMINRTYDPMFLETLIITAETRRRQLNPGFESESPRG